MTAEIPIWVDGSVQWLSGVDRRTSCRDVLELFVEGGGGGDVSNYELVERWRQVERPLDLDARLLKIWSHWGDERKEVRLTLRRVDHEPDSGRGSPVGVTPSLKRRRNRKSSKPPWTHPEELHPRRLAELGGFDKDAFQEYEMRRLEAEESAGYTYGEKTYATTQEGNVRRKNGQHGCPGQGILHSTIIEARLKKCCSKRSAKPKVRNSENIEKLMKLILAQGATIQTQLQKLKDREEQIEDIEVERHKKRVEKNGRNYLLETYLKGLKEAEVPVTDEEKGNDSGVHTEAGSEQTATGSEKEKEKDASLLRLRKNSVDGGSRRSRDKKIENSNSERTVRSKSESRSSDSEPKKALTRTLSENTVVESSNVEEAAPKEDTDDIVELTRIQSQVEMWEKVLKINKKLEKEEENLVKLHIQIRRIQSENIKIARDQNPGDPVSLSLQSQLEALRTDLDQNSKEIYHNFTQLIEEDEQVVQKQNHLAELINDIERTDHEHEMLNEMVVTHCSPPPPLPLNPPPELESEEKMGISLQVKGQEKIHDLILPTPSTSETEPMLTEVDGQRTEEVNKPKTLKISFDENVQSESRLSVEKPMDPSPVPSRNIKGILKYRKSDTFHLGALEKGPVNHGSNISPEQPSQKIGKTSFQDDPLGQGDEVCLNPIYQATHHNSSFGAAMANPVNHLFQNNAQSREPIYHPTSVPRVPVSYHQGYRPPPIGAPYPTNHSLRPNCHNASNYPPLLVTTKALIHDNDSSGSSDTSGLSSMYSASPTVEEATYVLNTLV